MTNRHLTHQFENAKAKAAATQTTTNAEQPAKGTVGQVVYQHSNHKTPCMVVLVDTAAYQTWRANPGSIATTQVIDSYDVLKYESGRSGIMNKPSKSELDAVFGTSKIETIVEFMLQHGSLHGSL